MSWVQVAIWVASLVISYALRPKPPGPTPPATLSEINVPTAEEGGEIPVVFGSPLIKSANVVYYGNLRVVAIRKKGGKK